MIKKLALCINILVLSFFINAGSAVAIYCKCNDSFAGEMCYSVSGSSCPSYYNGGMCGTTTYTTKADCDSGTPTYDTTPPGGSPSLEDISLSTEKLTKGTLDNMNPLKDADSSSFGNSANRTPGFFVSRLLQVVLFPLGGMLMFLLIVLGGFQMVSGSTSGNQGTVEAGKRRLTAAVAGFALLFASYWMWRLVEIAFGLGS